MTPQETFVTRLRRHRQRCGVSLEEMATAMRIKVELLEALERNDLAEWPRGLYARAWIRTYAETVGLDPIDTVDEFCRLFPHGDRRAQGTIREIAAIVAAPSEYRDEFSHPEDRRRGGSPETAAPKAGWPAAISQAARGVWLRVAAAAAPHFRTRRAPRTSL